MAIDVQRLQLGLKDLQGKGCFYWIFVLFLIPIGMLLGEWLGEQNVWVKARYQIYRGLQSISAHSITYPTRTAVVLIGDDEFWKGDLARRTPLKRRYLADLIRKIDAADPALIALDIGLRSQTADTGFVEHPDYQAETAELLSAIKTVSQNRPVVLPRTLMASGDHDQSESPEIENATLEREPSVYDGYNFETNNVSDGYVSLPYDIRQVPLGLKLTDNAPLDSFAAAIVRRIDGHALRDAQAKDESALPYGNFIAPEAFDALYADDVLKEKPSVLKSKLVTKIVLIGGAWHERAFRHGKQIDLHFTPVGEIGGVFVHANYVEAILTHQTTKPLSKAIAVTIEVALALFMAVIFAWNMGPWKKVGWAAGLSLGLVAITYFSWQNLGLFFDFFIPLILLAGHGAVERIFEWRSEAHNYAKKLSTLQVEEA